MEIQSEYINNIKIPRNVFGVFVTIRRSEKLSNYPEDIHGCIGYWSTDYSILTRKQIISHIMDVSHSALYNDKRREYFPPIEIDLGAIIEIDFMLQPLYNVHTKNGILENGEKFINSKYGLIVDATNGSRATYLPHVFPDSIEWVKLKSSLISKAGIVSNTNTNKPVKFLAYGIIQLKDNLIDVIGYDGYFIFLCKTFIDSFTKFTLKLNSDNIDKNTCIPYIIDENNASINKNDAVRNLSTIEVVINCIVKCNYDNKEIINVCRQVIKYYIKKLVNSTDYLSHANLVSLICTWNRIIENEFTISNQIIYSLKQRIPNAEEDFERGQIILAILEYMINNNFNNNEINIFIIYVYEIYNKSLSSKLKSLKVTLDNVFKMNWDSQVLYKLSLYHNSVGNNKINIFALLNKIALEYIKLFDTFNEKTISNLESNYLVVMVEGISNILNVFELRKSENKYVNKNNLETLKIIKSKLLKILMKNRWSNGFINFKDGTARLDITGHLLNAFLTKN